MSAVSEESVDPTSQRFDQLVDYVIWEEGLEDDHQIGDFQRALYDNLGEVGDDRDLNGYLSELIAIYEDVKDLPEDLNSVEIRETVAGLEHKLENIYERFEEEYEVDLDDFSVDRWKEEQPEGPDAHGNLPNPESDNLAQATRRVLEVIDENM